MPGKWVRTGYTQRELEQMHEDHRAKTAELNTPNEGAPVLIGPCVHGVALDKPCPACRADTRSVTPTYVIRQSEYEKMSPEGRAALSQVAQAAASGHLDIDTLLGQFQADVEHAQRERGTADYTGALNARAITRNAIRSLVLTQVRELSDYRRSGAVLATEVERLEAVEEAAEKRIAELEAQAADLVAVIDSWCVTGNAAINRVAELEEKYLALQALYDAVCSKSSTSIEVANLPHEDTKRLDWLEKFQGWVSRGHAYMDAQYMEVWALGASPIIEQPTLREAIDAGIAREHAPAAHEQPTEEAR